MTEHNSRNVSGRKRINRMKKVIVIIAVGLILASLILNIILMVRVIQLNQLIQQLYGLITLIHL